LHTTVLPLGTTEQLFPLEVHIRTDQMHRLAEYGIAGENWTPPAASASSGAPSIGSSRSSSSDALPSSNGAVSPTAADASYGSGPSANGNGEVCNPCS
jgi:hypothetical protein